MVRFKERKGQKESSDKMKLSNRILVLFCCCVCFICVGSMVAEKATVNAVIVNGIGYGTAVFKGIGTWRVRFSSSCGGDDGC